jgi:hypothetical protein
VKDATDKTRRITAPLENNIVPDTYGFAYSVQSVALPNEIKTSRVVFEDTIDTATADEVLIEKVEGGEALKKAKDFLQAMLAQTPMAVKKLLDEAERCGIKERTLQRAKDALGIESGRGSDRWYWYLPGTMPTKSVPDDDEDIVASLDHP